MAIFGLTVECPKVGTAFAEEGLFWKAEAPGRPVLLLMRVQFHPYNISLDSVVSLHALCEVAHDATDVPLSCYRGKVLLRDLYATE
jgi:hypothetical protein